MAPNEVDGIRLGLLICYESQYPQFTRRYRELGADALVVVTNDAWWGKSLFAKQHAQILASRARESGIPIIRAANDGVSQITDSRGRTTASTKRGRDTVLTGEVALAGGSPTFYARHGDWILGLDLLVLAGIVASAWWRRRPWPPA